MSLPEQANATALETISRAEFLECLRPSRDRGPGGSCRDVAEINQNIKETFARRLEALVAEDPLRATARLFPVLGPFGSGRTRLLAAFAAKTRELGGFYVHVDLSPLSGAPSFFRRFLQGFADGALREKSAGSRLGFLLETVRRLAGARLPADRAALERPLDGSPRQALELALLARQAFAPPRAPERSALLGALQALFLWGSPDPSLQATAHAFLQGEAGLEALGEGGAPAPSPGALCRELVFLASLGGAFTLLGVDELDSLVLNFQNAVRGAERIDLDDISAHSELLKEPRDSLNALLALPAKLFVAVAATPDSFREFSRLGLSAPPPGPEAPYLLQPLGHPELVKSLVVPRIRAAAKITGFQRPYQSWPFPAEFFESFRALYARDVLWACEKYARESALSGQSAPWDPNARPEPARLTRHDPQLAAIQGHFALLQSGDYILSFAARDQERAFWEKALALFAESLAYERPLDGDGRSLEIRQDHFPAADPCLVLIARDRARSRLLRLKVVLARDPASFDEAALKEAESAKAEPTVSWRRLLLIRPPSLQGDFPLPPSLPADFPNSLSLAATDARDARALFALAKIAMMYPADFQVWARKYKPTQSFPFLARELEWLWEILPSTDAARDGGEARELPPDPPTPLLAPPPLERPAVPTAPQLATRAPAAPPAAEAPGESAPMAQAVHAPADRTLSTLKSAAMALGGAPSPAPNAPAERPAPPADPNLARPLSWPPPEPQAQPFLAVAPRPFPAPEIAPAEIAAPRQDLAAYPQIPSPEAPAPVAPRPFPAPEIAPAEAASPIAPSSHYDSAPEPMTFPEATAPVAPQPFPAPESDPAEVAAPRQDLAAYPQIPSPETPAPVTPRPFPAPESDPAEVAAPRQDLAAYRPLDPPEAPAPVAPQPFPAPESDPAEVAAPRQEFAAYRLIDPPEAPTPVTPRPFYAPESDPAEVAAPRQDSTVSFQINPPEAMATAPEAQPLPPAAPLGAAELQLVPAPESWPSDAWEERDSPGGEISQPQKKSPFAPSGPVPAGATIPWGSEIAPDGLLGNRLELPLNALLGHVLVSGRAAIGKNVFIKRIVEEAALQGIPSLILDLSGDFSTLGQACPSPPPFWGPEDETWASLFLEKARVSVWTPNQPDGNCFENGLLTDFTAIRDDSEAIDLALKHLCGYLDSLLGEPLHDSQKASVEQAVRNMIHDDDPFTYPRLIYHLNSLLFEDEDTMRLEPHHRSTQRVIDIFRGKIGPHKKYHGAPPNGPWECLDSPDEKTNVAVVNLSALPDLTSRQLAVQFTLASLFTLPPVQAPSGLRALVVVDEARDFIPNQNIVPSKEAFADLADNSSKLGFGLILATHCLNAIDRYLLDACQTRLIGKLASPQTIQAANSLLGNGGVRYNKLKAGEFYLQSPYCPAPQDALLKIRTPFCLSRHPTHPLKPEVILQLARKSRRHKVR
ncbi:MAG: hypothetical protein LBO66_04025 [Deltaproteobacteria bacterium]|jgi:hypothetical protein|nr:hypothetical protein [Deltaproteobacteria bacterium]